MAIELKFAKMLRSGPSKTCPNVPKTAPEPFQTTPKRPATTPHASHATTHTSTAAMGWENGRPVRPPPAPRGAFVDLGRPGGGYGGDRWGRPRGAPEMQQGGGGLPHPEMKQGGGVPPPGGLRGSHLMQYFILGSPPLPPPLRRGDGKSTKI